MLNRRTIDARAPQDDGAFATSKIGKVENGRAIIRRPADSSCFASDYRFGDLCQAIRFNAVPART